MPSSMTSSPILALMVSLTCLFEDFYALIVAQELAQHNFLSSPNYELYVTGWVSNLEHENIIGPSFKWIGLGIYPLTDQNGDSPT